MLFRSITRRFVLLFVGALYMQTGLAQLAAIVDRYPSGSIQSDERADAALKDVEAERHAIDARYAESERACFDKFFATNCLQKAREQRRDALTHVRPIEIEAHTFKRRMRAEAHEKAAAERTAKRESQISERAQAAGSAPPTSGDSGTNSGTN